MNKFDGKKTVRRGRHKRNTFMNLKLDGYWKTFYKLLFKQITRCFNLISKTWKFDD